MFFKTVMRQIREELTRNLNKTLTENYYYNPGITKSADSMQEDVSLAQTDILYKFRIFLS